MPLAQPDENDRKLADFLQHAQERLNDVAVLLRKARSETMEIDQVAKALHAKVQTKLQQLHAHAVDTRADLRSCIDALRKSADAAVAAIEPCKQEIEGKASQASEDADGLLAAAKMAAGAVSGRADNLTQKVATEITERGKDVSQLGETLQTEFEDLKSALSERYEKADQEVVGAATKFRDESQELMEASVMASSDDLKRRTLEAMTEMKQTLSDDTSAFSMSVTRTVDVLRTAQLGEVSHLRQVVDDTRRKIDDVTTTFERLSSSFSRATSTVSSAMGKTQVGLKLTVGTFQNVKEILGSVS